MTSPPNISNSFWNWVEEAQEGAKKLVDEASNLGDEIREKANIETASNIFLGHLGMTNSEDIPPRPPLKVYFMSKKSCLSRLTEFFHFVFFILL